MASAVEQLAKNANWGALAKATDLKKRLLFVLRRFTGLRLGTYIPVPGIDPAMIGMRFSPKKKAAAFSTCSTCFPVVPYADDDFRAEYHALYLGLDYYAAGHRHVAKAGSNEERG